MSVSDISEDIIELQQKVEADLERLIKQTLVQKSAGETYVFLTNEEQEINRAVENQNIEQGEITAKVSELIFDGLYNENKYRAPELKGRYSYGFNRFVDNRPHKANQNFALKSLVGIGGIGSRVSLSRVRKVRDISMPLITVSYDIDWIGNIGIVRTNAVSLKIVSCYFEKEYSNYCSKTLYERFSSVFDYKYTLNQLVNCDYITNLNNSCIILFPITNSFAMPIAKDCTSLSLGLKSNSLFSNYLDNYWKHLCVFLLNSVNSTLQKVSLYRILSIILGMRVPHLLLKLRGYQIYQWMNLNMVGIDNHGRTAEIAHIESGLALLDEVFHFFPLKVKEDQIFRREFHIRRDKGIHVAYLTVRLLNFADDAFGISTRISFLQELAIHNGIGNCVLTRQIILLGIQSLCKSSQLRGSFEFNDVRSAIRFKQAVEFICGKTDVLLDIEGCLRMISLIFLQKRQHKCGCALLQYCVPGRNSTFSKFPVNPCPSDLLMNFSMK